MLLFHNYLSDMYLLINRYLSVNYSSLLQVKKYCVTLLEKYGSFAYTRDVLHQLDLNARAEVAALGGNPLLESILDELLNWDASHSPK